MNVHDEFTRRVAADRLCRELMRAIAENDTAALERLGMRGFGQYAGRLSELMTDSVRRELPGADDFGAIMDKVAKPAHYAHHLVNEGGSAIQQALDRRNGVRLRVIEPEFNDGRLKGIVGEASESDSENAADNLATQLGTFVKDMGNEFMRQNAEQRDRAGFKVTITRTGGAKCCPWCADRTGKWELANAPDGVFGCHDNCKCMVDYTNSKGAVSRRVGRSRFVDVPYEPPHRMSAREAAEKGAFSSPKRLTNEPKNDILKSEGKKSVWLPKGNPISHNEFVDLRSYAKSKGFSLIGFKNADVAIDLIREELDEAEKIISLFPELLGDERRKLSINLSDYMDDEDYAQIRQSTPNIIDFNANAFRSKERLREDYNRQVNEKWFVQGTSYRSIIVHELGHRYQRTNGITNQQIVDIALRAGNFSTREELFRYLDTNLSQYSAAYTDGREIISEVFSDYFTNQKPSEFSKIFVDELLKLR